MNKLVRDNIVEMIFREDPKVFAFHKEEDNQKFKERLIDKIIEEANELKDAKNIDNEYEEFGDLFEVVNTLFHLYIQMNPNSIDIIHNKIRDKAERLGAFEKRYFIDSYKA